MTEAKKPDNVEVLRDKAVKKHKDETPKKATVHKLEVKPATVQISGGEWDPADPEAPQNQPAAPAPDVTWPPTQDNSPQVVFHGKAVEPVMSADMLLSESMKYKDITFYFPWPTERFKDMRFNIYELDVKGRKLFLAMDSQSKLVIEAQPAHHHFVPGNGNLVPSAIVVMINSSSHNDFFVGESSLINVDSKNNVVNNSHLEATKKEQGNNWRIFLDEIGDKDRFVAGETQRHVYEGCRFKRSRIENSSLADGYYMETQISNAEIKSNGRIDVRGGRVSRSRIVGSDVYLDNASVNASTIDCSGAVRVNRISLNTEHFRTTGLNLNNKFAYATITAPHYSDLRLVRVSLNEFELGDGIQRTTLNIKDGPGKISEKIETLFNRMKGRQSDDGDRGRFDREAPDTFTRSILRYIMDSVLSRLRVIEMIDSAQSTLESVSTPSNRYDPYSTPFDL